MPYLQKFVLKLSNGKSWNAPVDVDLASFIASPDPELRQAVLIEPDEGFIQMLPSHTIAEATRLVVRDLLIQNTEANVPYPSIAHFLLFGSTNQEQGIQDPHALGAKRACIHIILDLINGSTTQEQRQRELPRHPESSSVRLSPRASRTLLSCGLQTLCASSIIHIHHEVLAHKRGLLCSPSGCSSFYRSRSRYAQDGETESMIQVIYEDGPRVPTTIPTLSFVCGRHHRAVSELFEILFNNESTLDEFLSEDDISEPFREVGQSHLRVIEFVQSLTFEWEDSLVVEPMEIQLLSQLNTQSCVRKDSSGCEIVDRSILLSLLTMARQSLFAQNKIVTQVQSNQLDPETNQLHSSSCAVKNNRRQVMFAVASGFEEWRRMSDTTLMECFEDLPPSGEYVI
ncbi:hypothetical protein K435DRAFT_853351 [Dendrothele bispora CBS 962.96]|uniref:Uncharacterized protein n=1 Tax=Dendrothele bispora (strain CBS 962.96) TaxID=1314807 RepID=A0A4S8MIB8_DENBC|nr:hypothetical protein K435DRAFT_853351 [Dendrothele bispora CBS 962.96]